MNTLAPPSATQLEEYDSTNFESFDQAPAELESEVTNRGTNALAPRADPQLNENESATNFEGQDEAPTELTGEVTNRGMNSLATRSDPQLNESQSATNFESIDEAPAELAGEIARGGMNALATHADPQLNEQTSPVNFEDEEEEEEIPPPSPGDSGVDIAEIEATENIPALSLVTAGGKIADSENLLHFNHVIGITMDPVVNGFISTCVVEGEVSDSSWNWPANVKLFLNGTTLSTTAVETGFSQLVGITRNSQTVFIRLQIPIKI